MDPRLRDQRRYLAALAAAAAPTPEVHRAQLAALAREVALAATAPDVDSYRRGSADLFELCRAAWLDRLLAHARVAAALDDPWTAQAAAVELTAALAARGHDDWGQALAAGSTDAAGWHAAAATAKSSFAGLVAAAVQRAWDLRPGSQHEAAAEAAARWSAWSAVEPAAAEPTAVSVLAAVRAALELPRYRRVTPWAGAGLDALAGMVADAVAGRAGQRAPAAPPAAATVAAMDAAVARWMAGLPSVGPGQAATGEPTVDDVVAPYAGLAALTGPAAEVSAIRSAARAMVDDAVGAVTPQAALAVWAERDRLAQLAAAPVRAGADQVIARAVAWPEPLRVAGAHALIADLSGTRTGCEVDLVSMHHGACAQIEAAWTRALGDVVLAPALATAIAGWDPAAVGGPAAAWRCAHAVAGVGRGLDRVPVVAQALAAVAGAELVGAELGEQGHALVGEVRAWLGAVGLARGDAAALVVARWGTPPPSSPRAVRLWDADVSLERLGPEVRPRPPVPGKSRQAAP
ncbi:MAG: hypothetical protein R3B06_29525 [Kofleriaceae bacterium]